MEMPLRPHEDRLVETARAFARERVMPHAAEWEAARRVPLDTFRAAADAGLAGLLAPREQGGAELSLTAFARVMEELSAGCLPFAFMLVVHNNLVGNIARNGTAEQVARFLSPLISGERVGAFCLTEPGAGSDAAAIVTTARRGNGEWVLDGEKAWITNAAVAGLFSVYAQTEPALGWRGIVCILVEDGRPGLEREPPYALMGGHAMGTGGMKLAGCAVPEDNLLLGPGDAFKAALQGIDIARAVVAAMCCGMMREGLETALEQASRRRVFGRTVTGFQGVQWQLADVATDLEAARLLAYRAAALIDSGREAGVAAAHAKKFATRAALTALSECMQVMGANGLRAEHPLGRHLASAKMTHYLDGATEIQNVIIARDLLKGRGDE